MKYIMIWMIACLAVFAQNVEMTVINVGQGDSIFIQGNNGTTILFDAGTTSDADPNVRTNALDNIYRILDDHGISKNNPLDYIFISHYHKDHYYYVDDVIQDYGVNKIIDRGGDSKYSGSKLAYLPGYYADAAKGKRASMEPGEKIDLGRGAYIRLLAIGTPDYYPTPDPRFKIWEEGRGTRYIEFSLEEKRAEDDIEIHGEYENSKSLVFQLSWNGCDVLLGGDCNEHMEPHIAQILRDRNINIDVYKVHHHGSATSSESGFVDAMQAEVALCSTGHSKIYKHPRREAYDRLYNQTGSFIFQTNEGYESSLSYAAPPHGVLARGNITLWIDGSQYYTIQTPDNKYEFEIDELVYEAGRLLGNIFDIDGQTLGRVTGNKVVGNDNLVHGTIFGNVVQDSSKKILGRISGLKILDADNNIVGRISGALILDASEKRVGRTTVGVRGAAAYLLIFSKQDKTIPVTLIGFKN